MIADTAVLSACSWPVDQMLFPKEHYTYKVSESHDLHALDMNIASLEAELERASNQSREEMTGTQLSLGSSTSCGTSVSGSECSDEICLDVESDVEALFPVDDHECITSSLINLLGGNPISDFPATLDSMHESLDMPDLTSLSSLVDLPMDSPNVAQYDCIPSVSAPCSPQPQRKRRNKRQSSSRERRSASSSSSLEKRPQVLEAQKEQQQQQHHSTAQQLCTQLQPHKPSQQNISSKPWSSLTSGDQLAIIEDLSKTISNEMGLREQVEVINIINPTASISSNDTEFVIDLDSLNDEKLTKIRELVRRHRAGATGSCSSSSSSSGVSDCSVESSTSKSPRRQTKRQQKAKQRENRQRQRKEYRQMLKERRSGLFQQEEVLSLTTSGPVLEADEDEDIDIV